MMGMTIEELEPLEDPRNGNAERHSWHDIMVIAPCTIPCGGGERAPTWPSSATQSGSFWNPCCSSGMEFPARIPSPGCSACWTRRRSTGGIPFPRRFLGFMGQLAQGGEGVLAIDGKTLRRSYDGAEAQSPLHLVNAWAAEQRLVLGQLGVDGQSPVQ